MKKIFYSDSVFIFFNMNLILLCSDYFTETQAEKCSSLLKKVASTGIKYNMNQARIFARNYAILPSLEWRRAGVRNGTWLCLQKSFSLGEANWPRGDPVAQSWSRCLLFSKKTQLAHVNRVCETLQTATLYRTGANKDLFCDKKNSTKQINKVC